MEVPWRPGPCQGHGGCSELSFIASPIIWLGALPSPGPLPLPAGSSRAARPGNESGGRHRCQRGPARSVWRWHGHIPAGAGHGVFGAGCVPEQRCPSVTWTCSSDHSSSWPLGLAGMASALGTGSSDSRPAQGSTHVGSFAELVVARSRGRPWHASGAAGDLILVWLSQF